MLEHNRSFPWNRPLGRVMGAFALAAMLAVAAPGSARAQAAEPAETATQERVDDLERQLDQLRSELEMLRAAMAEAKSDHPAPAPPADEPSPEERAAALAAQPSADALAEIGRRLDVLAAELERMKLGSVAAVADTAEYGLGPAASKIYRTPQGLSIGGYGEALYQGFDSTRDDGADSGATDQLDFLRAILYFGYKFNDRWLLNSEIELEHASTGKDGEASVEFAYFDYLARPELNARFGLLLLPMGFVNELHEPTVFLGARRPDTEQAILPTTWRENGFGLFGDVGPFTYRTYIVNGLKGEGFSSAGLRGGRQKGSKALAEDFAWVGRLDYNGVPGLLVGGSAYIGDSGQGLEDASGNALGVRTEIYEGHAEWRYRGFEVRGLFARAQLSDVAALNQALGLRDAASVGEEMEGYYVEAAYDVLNHFATGEASLQPYARWESINTQSAVPNGYLRNPARDGESLTLGLAFKPFDQLVFKLDYQDYENGADTAVDQWNIAFGYVF